jgi:hypothetical protein
MYCFIESYPVFYYFKTDIIYYTSSQLIQLVYSKFCFAQTYSFCTQNVFHVCNCMQLYATYSDCYDWRTGQNIYETVFHICNCKQLYATYSVFLIVYQVRICIQLCLVNEQSTSCFFIEYIFYIKFHICLVHSFMYFRWLQLIHYWLQQALFFTYHWTVQCMFYWIISSLFIIIKQTLYITLVHR